MLSSLRPRITSQSLPFSLRPLTTGGFASDNPIIANAFGMLNKMLPGSKTSIPSSSSPPKFVQQPPGTPPIIDIPPAEHPLLHYLTSKLLRHGRRSKASRITSRTLLHIHVLTRAPPLPVLCEAVSKASPVVRTAIHRTGAKNIPRPMALGEKQRTRLALEWILAASKQRDGRTVEERLAKEIIAVLEGDSSVLKKKTEEHRFAMVNRGNARFRV